MKKCFKCNKTKSVNEFYKHPGMADGRLGKCKECTKADVKKNRGEKSEYYQEYDRQRSRAASRREINKRCYRKRISTPEGRAAEWAKKQTYINSTKKAANTIVSNAIRDGKITKPLSCSICHEECSPEAHHEDYYAPLDIKWLCKLCHGQRHREINEAIRNGEDLSDRGF